MIHALLTPLAGNASHPKECQQPATPAACHPCSRTNTISRWAPAACHIRSQTNIDSWCALATCDLCSLGKRSLPFAASQASRTSANSRCHQPLAILASERMLTAGGHQPLVILAFKRNADGRCALAPCDLCSRLDWGLHLRGDASRTNQCQQAGAPSACHRRSRMNADSRWGRGAIPAVDLLLTESSHKLLSR